ncbi:MarR family transcriptional regulator [Natrinema versiforme]|uniref:Winged helix-turn-helix transcriptional regulator n=1 Tax=Natrinema versiforme TaxID=88724 RepID=A0A4P8WMN5_9EURY|nr:MarR family transcriptional regulator [Natrinema versiforme]QCS43251.1 winged helix-turn-helix transcriptional regulator [Natrinema versiforme]
MVITSQIGVRGRLESIHDTVSIDAVPASIRQSEGHAIASEAIGPQVGDLSGGPLSWGQLLRVASFWESALIAALFLLISGLVGLRIADVASDRDVDLSSLPLVTNAAGDGDDPDRTRAADHRAYESYLSPDTPPRLLSDEGRVVRLLIANHGRIRQHRIADETGWSKSKVSRICSRMHADGTIEKQSVGRENVITLSDRTPDDATRSDEVENPLP